MLALRAHPTLQFAGVAASVLALKLAALGTPNLALRFDRPVS
jgi:hypothetical protein